MISFTTKFNQLGILFAQNGYEDFPHSLKHFSGQAFVSILHRQYEMVMQPESGMVARF